MQFISQVFGQMSNRTLTHLRRLAVDESGVTLVEYAITLFVLCGAVVASFALLGTRLSEMGDAFARWF